MPSVPTSSMFSATAAPLRHRCCPRMSEAVTIATPIVPWTRSLSDKPGHAGPSVPGTGLAPVSGCGARQNAVGRDTLPMQRSARLPVQFRRRRCERLIRATRSGGSPRPDDPDRGNALAQCQLSRDRCALEGLWRPARPTVTIVAWPAARLFVRARSPVLTAGVWSFSRALTACIPQRGLRLIGARERSPRCATVARALTVS